MAQDAGLHHLRHAPEGLVDQHRRGDAGVIPDVAGVDRHQLLQGEMQPLLPVFQVIDHDEQLHAPGDQSCDGRAPDAQLREAEAPVDQQIVQAGVDAKRGEGEVHNEAGQGRDILLISVNPWYRFTNVQLAIPGEPHQNIPIFTFGKIEEREGKRIMPVALSVNHGFVSGYQIGLYLKEFQRLLDR